MASSLESLFLGWSAGRTFFHLAKNGPRSTTRSFATGRLASGSIVMDSALRVSTRVWQARRGIQLMRIAQVPHMPTRQEQRKERDGIVLALDDEQGVEDGHPAVEVEREELGAVWVGARA